MTLIWWHNHDYSCCWRNRISILYMSLLIRRQRRENRFYFNSNKNNSKRYVEWIMNQWVCLSPQKNYIMYLTLNRLFVTNIPITFENGLTNSDWIQRKTSVYLLRCNRQYVVGLSVSPTISNNSFRLFWCYIRRQYTIQFKYVEESLLPQINTLMS